MSQKKKHINIRNVVIKGKYVFKNYFAKVRNAAIGFVYALGNSSSILFLTVLLPTVVVSICASAWQFQGRV